MGQKSKWIRFIEEVIKLALWKCDGPWHSVSLLSNACFVFVSVSAGAESKCTSESDMTSQKSGVSNFSLHSSRGESLKI
jgi:hypothetical protein